MANESTAYGEILLDNLQTKHIEGLAMFLYVLKKRAHTRYYHINPTLETKVPGTPYKTESFEQKFMENVTRNEPFPEYEGDIKNYFIQFSKSVIEDTKTHSISFDAIGRWSFVSTLGYLIDWIKPDFDDNQVYVNLYEQLINTNIEIQLAFADYEPGLEVLEDGTAALIFGNGTNAMETVIHEVEHRDRYDYNSYAEFLDIEDMLISSDMDVELIEENLSAPVNEDLLNILVKIHPMCHRFDDLDKRQSNIEIVSQSLVEVFAKNNPISERICVWSTSEEFFEELRFDLNNNEDCLTSLSQGFMDFTALPERQ